MSMRKTEKWLLVQWDECDSREVVSAHDVNPPGEAKVGCVVHIRVEENGEPRLKKATIIGSSRDRKLLENQVSPVKLYEDPIAGPSGYGAVEEVRELDFCESESEWAPTEESSSEDSDIDEENKKAKLEKFSRSYTKNNSKVIRPCNRVPAVNTSQQIGRKRRQHRSRENNNNRIYRKSIADSTNIIVPSIDSIVQVHAQDILSMKGDFDHIAALITEIRKCFPGQHEEFELPNRAVIKYEIENNIEMPYFNESFNDKSDESNRSEDNVLITNKYNVANAETPKIGNGIKASMLQKQNIEEEQAEWIPIGSGQTLIHVDKFRKINLKTYSKATRTLLCAFFPRRTLATHSLTGKGSPAFKNKPAKTCLDPKIVSDIIIEVSKRFNVRESFVRSIITTKCADEAKMLRDRQNASKEKQKRKRKLTSSIKETQNAGKRRQIKRSPSSEEQENIPPALNGIDK